MPRAKQSDEGRKKMQHLMWLAYERPDSTYDLSECDAYEVPSGVYSMCKVLQKQVLLLHSNHLQSVTGNENNLADLACITELDLHGNELATLPEQLGSLTCLRVLNVAQNKLKSLPNALVKLGALQKLNVAGNKLNTLPPDMQQLSALRHLHLDGNDVKKLPVGLCQLSCTLVTLSLDVAAMTYPPAAVCQQGMEAVMRYLCIEAGLAYVAPDQMATSGTAMPDRAAQHPVSRDASAKQRAAATAAAEDAHHQYELGRERQRQEMMEREQKHAEEQLALARLVAESKAQWHSTMASITTETLALDKSMAQIQAQKEAERLKLLSALHAETLLSSMESSPQRTKECYSAQLVADILVSNEKMKNTEGILEQMKRERLTHEHMFVVKAEELKTLRKRELFDWMGAALFENAEFDVALQRLTNDRFDAVQRAQTIENESSIKLSSALSTAAQAQAAIAMELMAEEKWQMEAVETLLRQRDERTQRIAREINMVEHELATLTALEIRNRSERNDMQLLVLAEQRRSLAELLERLLDERAMRQKDLLHWMREMEQARQRDQSDFWLAQLQRLLDRKPAIVELEQAKIDENVKSVLRSAGAELYVPLFVKAGVTSFEMLRMLGESELRKIGIIDENVRHMIVKCSAIFFDRRYELLGKNPDGTVSEQERLGPSSDGAAAAEAPGADAAAVEFGGISLSAVTLHLQKECVVCMDKEASVIFLPCGHACSCSACSTLIRSCPMCRGDITQRLPFTS